MASCDVSALRMKAGNVACREIQFNEDNFMYV